MTTRRKPIKVTFTADNQLIELKVTQGDNGGGVTVGRFNLKFPPKASKHEKALLIGGVIAHLI